MDIFFFACRSVGYFKKNNFPLLIFMLSRAGKNAYALVGTSPLSFG